MKSKGGYICDTEEREDEESLVEYIKENFDLDLAVAANGSTTDSEIMRRFINEDYGYTKEEACLMMIRLKKEPEKAIKMLEEL